MLIEADASGLEVVGAAYLSQDETLCDELWNGVDIHESNRQRFGFKDGRVKGRTIAKIFKFRLIYGGTNWSYVKDPEFNWISKDPDYWQGIIDEYYNKYTGLGAWHEKIVKDAMRDGCLVMPTGRIYTYQPYFKNEKWVWPRTTILNYPVQGLGHDLMAIARISAFKRLRDDQRIKFIHTVHDSIILDVDKTEKECYTICRKLEDVFHDIPGNFERVYGIEFNLPMKAEVKFGMNWRNMTKFDREKHK